MDIDQEKKSLRKQMLLKRGALNQKDKESYDKWVCKELIKEVSIAKNKVVHAYLPMANEIDITLFLSYLLNNNITVVTPKTLPKRKLQNLILNSLDDIEEGVFGTTHPANSVEYNGKFDLIVIPGLAFDDENYRLGYGGGYYDNFIINHSEANKVGIFYPFQQINNVPIEPHDVCLDKIVTNSSLTLNFNLKE